MVRVGLLPRRRLAAVAASFLLLAVRVVVVRGGDVVRFSKAAVPKFTDLDMVELYYLRSFPYQAMLSEAGSFKLQTSGLALRSTLTLDVIVLEYKPLNISACYLPLVDRHTGAGDDDGQQGSGSSGGGDGNAAASSNGTLVWDKRAFIAYDTEIDSRYWQQSTFLGRINGIVYRNYLNWLETYQAAATAYVPESICSNADEESCFTTSHTGETFLAASLEKFASMSVTMHAIIPPRASEVHLLSFTEPRLISLVDVAGNDGRRGTTKGGGRRRGKNNGGDAVGGGSGSGTTTTGSTAAAGGDGTRTSTDDGTIDRAHGDGLAGGPAEFYAHPPGRQGDVGSSGENGVLLLDDDDDTEGRRRRRKLGGRPRGLGAVAAAATHGGGRGAGLASAGPALAPSMFPSPSPSPLAAEDAVAAAAPPGTVDSLLPPPASSPAAPAAPPAFNATADVNGTLAAALPPDAPSAAPTSVATLLAPNVSVVSSTNTTDWFTQNKKEEALSNGTRDVSEARITRYYVDLIICMQAYQLEYFADALKSCLTESDGYVHKDGVQYYHIRPRHPFAFKHDYWQPIPPPVVVAATGQDISDIVLSLAILVAAVLGLAMALWRLQLFQWCCSKVRRLRRRRVSAKAPQHGGYDHGASELPVYRVWGGAATVKSAAYASLRTADPDAWDGRDGRGRWGGPPDLALSLPRALPRPGGPPAGWAGAAKRASDGDTGAGAGAGLASAADAFASSSSVRTGADSLSSRRGGTGAGAGAGAGGSPATATADSAPPSPGAILQSIGAYPHGASNGSGAGASAGVGNGHGGGHGWGERVGRALASSSKSASSDGSAPYLHPATVSVANGHGHGSGEGGYRSVINFDGGRELSIVSAFHSADQNESGDSLRLDSDEEDVEEDGDGGEEEDRSGLLDVSNGDEDDEDEDEDDGHADGTIQLAPLRKPLSPAPAPAPPAPTDVYPGWDGGDEDLLGLDVTAHGGPPLKY